MFEWWQGLTATAKWFYSAAVFFSVFFLWQFISALIGLSGAEDVDVDADVDVEVDADVDIEAEGLKAGSADDAAESVAAFKLLSIRSILAFLTMFFWAGAMYLDIGKETAWAIGYATLWGLGGFVTVAVVVNMMRRLAESGSPRLVTCVGTTGTVYLKIPPGGEGEARVTVSGALSYVKARGAGGQAIEPGTPVRVVRALKTNIIEVEPIDRNEAARGQDQ